MGRWLLFPPFISCILFLASVFFAHKELAFVIPPMIWGLAIAAYMCMCAISLFNIIRRESPRTGSIALLAQGLLATVLAVHFGAYAMSWFGLIVFLIGLVMSFIRTTRGDQPLLPMPARAYEQPAADSSDQIFSKLGLPICYTDEGGTIEEATLSFLDAVEREPADTIGEQIDNVIPVDDEVMMLPTGRWWLNTLKSGTRSYYLLMPTKDGRPAADEPVQRKPKADDMNITDSATALYTPGYGELRAREELIRAQKYKRPLSGILLEMDFDTMSPMASLSGEQVGMIRTAFAQKVKEVLRDTDIGSLMEDNRQIMLLLPETPQAAAKTLISHLQILPQEIFDDDIRSAVNPKVHTGLFSYGGGGSAVEYGVFMASLEQALAASKEG